ncbi:MAG: ACT domain-containing protein [Planctomycetota bacterium]
MSDYQTLSILPSTLAVCRLEPGDPIPAWTAGSEFTSITRTSDELSVVCSEESVPDGPRCERGWRALKLMGPFAFDETGILESVLKPLAARKIGVLAICTFDTDYVLVKGEQLVQAVTAIREAGHTVDH